MTLAAPIPFVIVNAGDTFDYAGRSGVILKVNPSKYVIRMDDDGKEYNLPRTARINITGSKPLSEISTKPDFYPTQHVRITEGKSKGTVVVITKVDPIKAVYSGHTLDGVYNIRNLRFDHVEAAD